MATVASSTLTINAPFLQEIKDDNRELKQLLEASRQEVRQIGHVCTHCRRLATLLSDLRDQLALHFSLEEAFGYFEHALAVAPRLTRRAEGLRAQHQQLFLEVCDLSEAAEQLRYHEVPPEKAAEIAWRFEIFHEHYRDHESQEADLIFAALDDDLGGGD